ncbi:MAG: aldolase/citrate lyase family protein [Sciscionella sp.]
MDFQHPKDGVFVKLASTQVIDMILLAGVDFAIIDLEHSALDTSAALALVRHADAIGLPAVVRIPEVDKGLVNRVLEAGASGLQLSMTTRVSQVHALLDAMHYPPRGSRSLSNSHPGARYGALSTRDYLALAAGAPPLAVVQIETARTVDPLNAIAAAGADVVFIGGTDLSVDVGLSTERLNKAVQSIVASAECAGVVLGGAGIDHLPQNRYRVSASDVVLLGHALTSVPRAASPQGGVT